MAIEVTYNGSYPNSCSGRLEIKVDGNIVYSEVHCCNSSGSVWFDKDWDSHVEDGELTWDDKDACKFSQEIRDAVRTELSKVHVCCGGCV
jgi:hypothetical protein